MSSVLSNIGNRLRGNNAEDKGGNPPSDGGASSQETKVEATGSAVPASGANPRGQEKPVESEPSDVADGSQDDEPSHKPEKNKSPAERAHDLGLAQDEGPGPDPHNPVPNVIATQKSAQPSNLHPGVDRSNPTPAPTEIRVAKQESGNKMEGYVVVDGVHLDEYCLGREVRILEDVPEEGSRSGVIVGWDETGVRIHRAHPYRPIKNGQILVVPPSQLQFADSQGYRTEETVPGQRVARKDVKS